MRAVVYESNEIPLKTAEIPSPRPGPGQLLLDVAACGICGSDLHAYQVGLYPQGMVPGHEFSGTVAAVGEGVDGDWGVGDRVISLGALVCGRCPACRAGKHVECEQIALTGFSTAGAYAEQVLVSEPLTIPIPESMSFATAALVEPLTVGLAAVRDTLLPMGGNVLVLGAGVIGIAVAKWARFFGAGEVVVSDLETERLQRATDNGATAVIDAAAESDPVAACRRLVGCEPDVIVECVGRPMLKQLSEVAPVGCHIVSVGVSMQDEPINPQVATQKKLRITFSFGYGLEDFRFVVKMIDQGRMPVQGLVTARVALAEVPDMFEELMKPSGHCKVLIEPQS